MDRPTVYFGQLARETDILTGGQFAMTGLAKLSAGVLGTVNTVNGFTCTPTGPASLNVIVTAGEIYQAENLEQTVWSSLPADTVHTIVKQGLLLDPVTLAITPPGTVGFSQVYMIEVQYQDFDTGSVVLPYFNAANPTVPFTGPGNSGAAQNTVRKGLCAVQIKAGTAAATGTQVAPTQDVGWTGLFLVTVANGQTTITSGNIVTVPGAPFIPVTLPLVPAGVQNGTWVYAADTGAVNAMVATVAPIPGGLIPGMEVRIKAVATNTGATTFNLNGLGAAAVHRANGAALSAGDINANMVVALVWDGSAWQIQNYFGFTSSTINNNTFVLTIPYVVDSGSVNALVASFSPAITGPTAGQFVEVKAANTNTGAATLNPNALGAAAIVHQDGTALNAGDIQAGGVLLLAFDGTHWQLVSSGDLLIDTAVTFTVHGGGANFTDLNAAAEYLSRYTITHNGQVTLQLAAGVFTYTATMVYLDHPQNHRILILGATMLAAVGTTDSSYVASTATNMTYLRTKFATELHFTGGAGMEVNGIGLNALDGILITGDGTTSATLDGQGLAFTGTYSGTRNTVLGTTHANGLAVCGFGGYGITVISGGAVVFPWTAPIIVIGNVNFGMTANARSLFYSNGNIIAFGNGVNGVTISQGSTLWCAATIYAENNGSTGVVANNMGFILASGFATSTLSPALNTVGNNNSLIT